MSLAYRGLEHVAAARYAHLADTRADEIAALAAARTTYARRVARIAAGAAGTLGALFVFGCAIIGVVVTRGFWREPDSGGFLTHGLIAVWPIAAIVYVVARIVARARIDAMLERPLARTGDWARDLSRLELSAPARVLETRTARLEGWSAALPLVALSFLTPLTLHLFVAIVLAGKLDARAFDEWIAVSVAIVGHAHLVLAICAMRFGLKLAVREMEDLHRGVAGDCFKAYGFTVLAGALPGAIFFLVPPILVAITGIVFVPFMFVAMKRRIVAERLIIESTCTD